MATSPSHRPLVWKCILRIRIVMALSLLAMCTSTMAQEVYSLDNGKVQDIVWMTDNSRLIGQILEWDLERGMRIQLATGAVINIPKDRIKRVQQHWKGISSDLRSRGMLKPYAFRETGMYHSISAFVNTSFLGGLGMHYSAGHRFSRMFGVGLGIGFESNDMTSGRNFIPVYLEARGFFLPKKITPYYAVKIGQGFAVRGEDSIDSEAKGGFHFSPELGIRFGGGTVNYYLGIEYKLQSGTFTLSDWWGGGNFTEEVRYSRVEFRTGVLF